jgi:putative transposase
VSRSGYYAWKKSREAREERRRRFDDDVRRVFDSGEGVYGAGRICGMLRKEGIKASFERVSDSMRRQGMKSIHLKRRQRALTNSTKARGDGYENLVKGMEIVRPFQVLCSDISYIRTQEGFAYLCVVKDVASGTILSTSMSDRMEAEFVLDAIRKALKSWKLPSETIFHSDRGSRYTSSLVTGYLSRNGIRQSFSGVGKPGDNSWSESFFSVLKKEAVHWVHFRTRGEAFEAMFVYIQGFYNTRRAQERLDYLSPLQWLEDWYFKNSIEAA